MIIELLRGSAFFGVFITLAGFCLGMLLKRRFKLGVFNPIIVATVFVIVSLLLLGIDYEIYESSAKYLSYFITPATICLAVPLYRQMHILRASTGAIAVGIAAGVLSSMASILLLSMLFNFRRELFLTLLPKATTTPIALGISHELGGITPLTVIAVVLAGNLGNLLAIPLCRLFRLEEPIAKGIAIGSSSHVIGTVKAFEIGETEGATSSLSIILAGLLTVFVAPFFAALF